jgi:hypothetical protein
MGLPHQVSYHEYPGSAGLDFIISTVTVHTLERELGMSWRNPHMASLCRFRPKERPRTH